MPKFKITIPIVIYFDADLADYDLDSTGNEEADQTVLIDAILEDLEEGEFERFEYEVEELTTRNPHVKVELDTREDQ